MTPIDGIRDAHESEVELLEGLQLRASLVWEEYRDDLLAHPDAIELPPGQVQDGRVRVAVARGRITGFSVALPGAGGVTELDGLFVDPDLQHGGIGRSLVVDVIAAARARGDGRVDVTAGPAVGFYERIGFVVGEPVPTRFGPARRLHLDLGG